MIRLFTIGFTRKSAAEFFEGLQKAGVRQVIDTRLNNTSQLSGFAKQADLRYFLSKIGDIDYTHKLSLAPTKEILDAYKKKSISWQEYSNHYLELIQQRHIESSLNVEDLQDSCFLCSEDKPHFCHRRLAAEYLQSQLNNIEIIHL
ncbi:MAG: DUF488 family protein [Prochlorotrichaceae cyanobacterium]|jgi:uncharacterized protein (DUF488 family)